MVRHLSTQRCEATRRRTRHLSGGLLLLIASVFTGGCAPSNPFYFFEDGDLSHYEGVATQIEYPDVETCSLPEVENAAAPFTLGNHDSGEVWELSLEEAMYHALVNGKVLKSIGGQVQTTPSQLTSAPGSASTTYAPAIVESDPRFGTEAALAAFDAQFTTSMFWEKNDRPVNLFFGNFLAPVLEQDLGTFQSEVSKTTATGGTFALRNNTSYEWNSNPSNRFPSTWNTDMEAEFRHPLLQGAGVQFNRIAGPSAIPGFYNGVSIARINHDISLADFELAVRNLASDVELAYWELYFAYRNLDSVIAGRDSALETWRKVYALFEAGAQGGEAENEAQAREQYYLFLGQVQNALSNLYSVENRLRYLMGLAATDGRLIRPADDPTTAKVEFDWHEVMPEALARNTELRRQSWQIKQRELQLVAAKNFLLPRLDAVGRYRWRGFGDDFIDPDNDNPPFDNAWETLTGGDFQEWQLGLQLSVPIGFRQPLAAVRNAQLQLVRERAVLEEQELEVTHQLTDAIRDVDRYYELAQSNFNRRSAAKQQVDAVRAAYDTGTVTLDLLLDAQRRLADAESSYYRSLVDYNLAIRSVHLRKGTLLEYNGVQLAEGPWPAKAYHDAKRRARERDAGLFLDYGFTRPNVFSRGPDTDLLDGYYESEPIFDEPYMEYDGEPVPTPMPGTEHDLPRPSPEVMLDQSTTNEPVELDVSTLAESTEVEGSEVAGVPVAAPKTAVTQTPTRETVVSVPSTHDGWGRATHSRRGEPVSSVSVRQVNHDEAQLRKAPVDERQANQPAGRTDSAASGWKRVQR